jgi:hypothetical protein
MSDFANKIFSGAVVERLDFQDLRSSGISRTLIIKLDEPVQNAFFVAATVWDEQEDMAVKNDRVEVTLYASFDLVSRNVDPNTGAITKITTERYIGDGDFLCPSRLRGEMTKEHVCIHCTAHELWP